MSISVGIDFGEHNRRTKAAANHGAAARKWMDAQVTNVLAEARSKGTAPLRLDELARNGTAPVRTAVAGNPSSLPETLFFLSTADFLTSEIAQKLTRNASTPLDALVNIANSTFHTWFGNRERILAHPNWKK